MKITRKQSRARAATMARIWSEALALANSGKLACASRPVSDPALMLHALVWTAENARHINRLDISRAILDALHSHRERGGQ